MSQIKQVDFDIHGLVGIRLLNPTPADAAAVEKQLGFKPSVLSKAPDIRIRFEKHLPLPDLRLLGLNAGFNEDGYYILRSSKADAKVRIPFEQVGGPCEILCESGLRSVPLLIAILNLTLLNKNCLPLHASAFDFQDQGILVTGWSKGGKTEALLAFTHHGARYVGDEWVVLDGDGDKMYGLPEPVTVWDWHMRCLPGIRKKLSKSKARVFRAVRFLEKIQRASAKGFIKNSFGARLLREAMPAFKRQMHVNIPPNTLFDELNSRLVSSPRKVFFIMSHRSAEITVDNIDNREIVHRMISSIEYEQLPFREHYLTFKFAFPDKHNTFYEQAPKLQYELLSRALAEKEAFLVKHPYPVSLMELYEKMKPFCEIKMAAGTQTTVDEKPVVELDEMSL